MLQIIIAWIYISLVCWAWGYLIISAFLKAAATNENGLPCVSIVCITGVSGIAVISAVLSLVMPLGGVLAQSIILLPALCTWLVSKNARSSFVTGIKKIVWAYQPSTAILHLCLLILLLILGASVINHPDSTGYHIQTIKWIAEYKVIPGLVHLHTPLGYQGLWYCLCAIFGFGFTHTNAVTFINTTVLVWYLLFVIQKINTSLNGNSKKEHKNYLTGILYLLLLASSYWGYGQVRLTATSASPDFIATLFIWLIFYLLVNVTDRSTRHYSLMLLGFLCPVAVGIKLSCLPVLLVMAYALYRLMLLKKTRAIIVLSMAGFITVAAFVARNIITTGYLIFPSAFPDIVHADWKFPLAATIHEKEYITSYARTGHQAIDYRSAEGIQSLIPGWFPVWWQLKTFADKLVLVTLACLLVLAALNAKKIWQQRKTPLIFPIIILLPAIAFWFFEAPDPRFGLGFIISFQGIIIYFLCTYLPVIKWARNLLLVSTITFSCLIAGYTVYRLKNYFSPAYILQPAGAINVQYTTIHCGNLDFNVPLSGGCANAPLPCMEQNDCSKFSARGNSVSDGFRTR